jgi:hypothetical protein
VALSCTVTVCPTYRTGTEYREAAPGTVARWASRLGNTTAELAYSDFLDELLAPQWDPAYLGMGEVAVRNLVVYEAIAQSGGES